MRINKSIVQWYAAFIVEKIGTERKKSITKVKSGDEISAAIKVILSFRDKAISIDVSIL